MHVHSLKTFVAIWTDDPELWTSTTCATHVLDAINRIAINECEDHQLTEDPPNKILVIINGKTTRVYDQEDVAAAWAAAHRLLTTH